MVILPIILLPVVIIPVVRYLQAFRTGALLFTIEFIIYLFVYVNLRFLLLCPVIRLFFPFVYRRRRNSIKAQFEIKIINDGKNQHISNRKTQWNTAQLCDQLKNDCLNDVSDWISMLVTSFECGLTLWPNNLWVPDIHVKNSQCFRLK